MSDPRARTRAGVYALIVAAAVGAWLPYLIPAAERWYDARRTRLTTAILYTTDTRGFLESCG